MFTICLFAFKFLLKFILKNNKQNNTRSRPFYFDQTAFKTHQRKQIILFPLHKIFLSLHIIKIIKIRQIVRVDIRKIHILCASPDAAEEQRTIRKMVRPPDVPKESKKHPETDGKRLAAIPATKES